MEEHAIRGMTVACSDAEAQLTEILPTTGNVWLVVPKAGLPAMC
jgi:hypothetical protein